MWTFCAVDLEVRCATFPTAVDVVTTFGRGVPHMLHARKRISSAKLCSYVHSPHTHKRGAFPTLMVPQMAPAVRDSCLATSGALAGTVSSPRESPEARMQPLPTSGRAHAAACRVAHKHDIVSESALVNALVPFDHLNLCTTPAQ
jgi:hypothetical protein